MKITKAKLKQIIKEELGKVSEGRRTKKGREERLALYNAQKELQHAADEKAAEMGWPAQVRFDTESRTYWIQNAETQEKMWPAEESEEESDKK